MFAGGGEIAKLRKTIIDLIGKLDNLITEGETAIKSANTTTANLNKLMDDLEAIKDLVPVLATLGSDIHIMRMHQERLSDETMQEILAEIRAIRIGMDAPEPEPIKKNKKKKDVDTDS